VGDCIDCVLCGILALIAQKAISLKSKTAMASITIRNLEEDAKQALRERAARNGRSMEEELREMIRNLPAGGGDASPVDGEVHAAHAGSPAGAGGPLAGRTVLLVITGGIAAYKSLDLIRRLRERGARVRVAMTQAACNFVTPLAAGAIAGGQVFTDLFDRAAEHDIGHVRLAREADLVCVAPATADFLARMAHGLAPDIAGAILLAARAPVLVAPAMNPAMWAHPATRRAVALLEGDGVGFIGPETGEMAEAGEAGAGRMSEPLAIAERIVALLAPPSSPDPAEPGPLSGLRAIVTSGPTHEPIDPVRYIANRSSGKQGHAIAAALAALGARVTLVSGPVTIPDPHGVETIHVETARQMRDAAIGALPADIAVMVAAVADWRTVSAASGKIKKDPNSGPPMLELTENPDILREIGHHANRPRLVVGFAAETDDVERHARIKLEKKRADWIVANDVSPQTGIMGGERNEVHVIDREAMETWPDMPKEEVARRLVQRIAGHFSRA
jgi:phosphopantothenoylcysteine decarboxylase/phosphopantothenate--cysteine ligase